MSDVIVGRPPRNAVIVGVVVDLGVDPDSDADAERIRDAAESLRAAGLALVLSPAQLKVRTKRRPWWRPNRTKEVHQYEQASNNA